MPGICFDGDPIGAAWRDDANPPAAHSLTSAVTLSFACRLLVADEHSENRQAVSAFAECLFLSVVVTSPKKWRDSQHPWPNNLPVSSLAFSVLVTDPALKTIDWRWFGWYWEEVSRTVKMSSLNYIAYDNEENNQHQKSHEFVQEEWVSCSKEKTAIAWKHSL